MRRTPVADDFAVSDTQHLQLAIRVICWPDKPGVALITAGETVLYKNDGGEGVIDVSVRTRLPFHIHFENLAFSTSWRGPK